MNLEFASLSQMVTEVGGIVHHEEASAEAVIVAALNRALSAVPRGDWPQLSRTDESGLRQFSESTIATFEADDAYYPGPLGVDKVTAIVPQVSGCGPIEIIQAIELQDKAQGQLSLVGLPRYAALAGYTIQHRKSSGAANCTVTCSVATNDNSKVLRVDYDKGAAFVGGQSWEDVDGGFLAGVALNTTVQGPYGLRRLSVPAGWVGTITFTISGTAVAIINTPEEPPTNSNSAHDVVMRPLYRLWPTPDADYACSVSWLRAPMKLTEDEDVPEMPVSPHLVLAAAADIFRSIENNASMADRYEGQAQRALRQIVTHHRGYQRVVARPFMGSFTGQTGSA